jgi:phospholipid transport system substrate-binding protein
LLWLLALAVSALPAHSQAAGSAKPPTAREHIQGTLVEVSRILLDGDLERRAKRNSVQKLIDTNVDFETVSRLVLAQNWKRFSETQQKDFVGLFRRHLLHTYWKNADYSNFVGIEVTGDRKEQRRDWTVMTKVKNRGSEDILIDYRLRAQGEEGAPVLEWRIIDILVEGVSLVANFRSQFQSIVANDGPEQLNAQLREKVAQAEREKSGPQ